MGLCTLEEAGLLGTTASEIGIAYVTGTADLAEGEKRRQRLGMGAVSCRQGQHTRVSAPQKVGYGALAAYEWEVNEVWAWGQKVPS